MVTSPLVVLAAAIGRRAAVLGARFGHQLSHQFSHHLMKWRPAGGRSCRWGRLLAGRAGRRLASLFRLPAPLPTTGAAPAGGAMPPAGRLPRGRCRFAPAHPCHERWGPA
jgi:hypothetical protein